MLIRKPRKSDPAPSEITPESVYLNRRQFMGVAAGAAATAAVAPGHLLGSPVWGRDVSQEELTPYEDVTTYNNYYEFGVNKEDPALYSGNFVPMPWTVEVTGHCNKPGTYDVWDLLRRDEVEDRTYRLRCVEAWSMVIPWQGVPLRNVVSRLEPTNQANFVAFETVYRPSQMPHPR